MFKSFCILCTQSLLRVWHCGVRFVLKSLLNAPAEEAYNIEEHQLVAVLMKITYIKRNGLALCRFMYRRIYKFNKDHILKKNNNDNNNNNNNNNYNWNSCGRVLAGNKSRHVSGTARTYRRLNAETYAPRCFNV